MRKGLLIKIFSNFSYDNVIITTLHIDIDTDKAQGIRHTNHKTYKP